MKRHNFNVDFDKDVLQNDAELMESIDFLLYKSSQNNRKYKIVEILRESYYDGVICLGRVMELEEIFHFDLRRFMLKNPYIYICEDAIRSKTITDVNKFIAKQVGTKYVHQSKNYLPTNLSMDNAPNHMIAMKMKLIKQ